MNQIIQYVSTVLGGGLLMMWGIANFILQYRDWSANSEVLVGQAQRMRDAGWTYSWIVSAAFSVLPFVCGLLLCKSVFAMAASKSSLKKSS